MKKEVLKEPHGKKAFALLISWMVIALIASIMFIFVPFCDMDKTSSYVVVSLVWVSLIANIALAITTAICSKKLEIKDEKKPIAFLPFKNIESLIAAIILLVDVISIIITIQINITSMAAIVAQCMIFILSINMLFAFFSKAYRYLKHK